MVKTYRKKNFRKGPVRKSAGRKKNENLKKMMGHVANKALDYAKTRPGAVGSLARGLGMLKKFINVETKYIDIVQTPTPINNNPTGSYHQLFNPVIQGDQYNQRNGQSIVNKSVTMNIYLQMQSAAVTTLIKVALVMDKKPDVGTPDVSSVFGTTATPLSQIDTEENGDRFVILKHDIICLDSSHLVALMQWYVDLTETHTLFDSAGNDIEKNALWLFTISDQPTLYPAISVNSRFRFYDN